MDKISGNSNSSSITEFTELLSILTASLFLSAVGCVGCILARKFYQILDTDGVNWIIGFVVAHGYSKYSSKNRLNSWVHDFVF